MTDKERLEDLKQQQQELNHAITELERTRGSIELSIENMNEIETLIAKEIAVLTERIIKQDRMRAYMDEKESEEDCRYC